MKEIVKNLIYIARQFKLATTFNLLGLIMAFAIFYVLMTQVIYQGTYNHSIEDYKRMYRMECDFVYNEWEFGNLVCIPFAEPLSNMDEVESYSVIYNPGVESFITQNYLKGDKNVTYPTTEGNNTAISALTNKVVDGSIEWTEDDSTGYIIPASIAQQYFGTEKAAGKKMLVDYSSYGFIDTVTVRGVYQDFPKNCELDNRIYFNYKLYTNDTTKYEFNSGYQCIIKFKTVPSDMKAFTEKLKQAIIHHTREGMKDIGLEDKVSNTVEEIKMTNFRLTPLKNSYFEHTSFTPGDRGLRGVYHILLLTCLLVIVIAAVNFLNFTLAESPMRIRSLNTRIVLGTTPRSLRLGILGEGIVTSVTACIIALIICRLLQHLPVVHQLTEGSLGFGDHWLLIVVMLALAVLVGIVASFYPGVFSTSIPPSIALKSSFGLTPQGVKLRKALTILQLCISLLMIIYVGILFQQRRYIFNSECGYDRDGIMLAELPLSYDYPGDNDSLYQAISPLPGIEQVAFSQGQLGQADGHSTLWTKCNGKTFKYSLLHVSRNYLSMMGIKVIEGRDFVDSDSVAVIINQAGLDRLKWLNLGSIISTGISDEEPDSAEIVGVCENIRYGSARIGNQSPFCFVFKKGYPYLNNMIVRVGAETDHKALQQQVNDVLRAKYDSGDTQAKYFDSELEQTYKSELQFTQQMVIICIICQLIMLIGIICITLFDTEYRRKEIGIRKISGATSGEIVWMLCRHYVKYLLIAFAIAAPLAIFFGLFTLNYFKQHTRIDWWLFPLALVVVGGIVLGTVALRSLRAARENPVNSIKSE